MTGIRIVEEFEVSGGRGIFCHGTTRNFTEEWGWQERAGGLRLGVL